MITLRQAYIEDLILLGENSIDPDINDINNDPVKLRKWAQRNMDYGPAYTAEDQGQAVAAAGVWLVRPGVGFIWIVVSKDIKRSFSFLRDALLTMRNMTEILAETFNLKKIRALSKVGFGQSQSMLEHLGFERLRKCRKSYYLYVRRF